ncbi:capsid cement protein, partial [Oceanicella sp. SM1341]|uniref:capsid cement protein n=1 Tax=Oceanicella sp. SM1341 TaxID=1548889 RepID=UPI0035167E6D
MPKPSRHKREAATQVVSNTCVVEAGGERTAAVNFNLQQKATIMKTYIQPGDNLTIPAPADTDAGAGVAAGLLFGVAQHDAATG